MKQLQRTENSQITPATADKRKELQYFIKEMLKPHPAVQGVAAIGSMATGRMTLTSDIDAYLFLDPFDWYIVPAEFKWQLSDQSFHSIFTADLVEDVIQFDFARVALPDWESPDFELEEGQKHELAAGWLAYDRSGRVKELISRFKVYDEGVRLARLDEAITWLDQHLQCKDPLARWEKLGAVIAHDRLEAAYSYLVKALFAFNRVWLPWRNRRMGALLALDWLPANFEERILVAGNAPSLDLAGYKERLDVLQQLFQELLSAVTQDGTYSYAPIDQAFMRSHDEPGYAWNMEEWNQVALARAIAIKKGLHDDG